jgi:GT2 family glycosyltransferase
MIEKPILSIVIVNYNSASFLRDCLSSIYSSDIKATFEIIVYDNGDPEPEMDSIEKDFSDVKFITDVRHVSYAAANNAGARESGGDYILFLNPDTIVKPGAIDGLLEFNKNTPDCGAVGPRLVNRDGVIEISWAFDPGILSEAYMKLLKSLPPALKYRIFGIDGTRKTDVVVGAALMLRREAFLRVEGFDEGYPLYFEESDLCLRIRQMGWEVYYYPKVEILHYLGSAGGVNKQSPQKKELTRSRIKYRTGQLRYYKKHRGIIQNLFLKMYLFIKFGRNKIDLITGKQDDNDRR